MAVKKLASFKPNKLKQKYDFGVYNIEEKRKERKAFFYDKKKILTDSSA